MVKKIKDWVLSWLMPVDKKVLLLAGDRTSLDLTGLTRDEIHALAHQDTHFAKYRPYPDAYYILVGTSVDVENSESGGVLYRLKDPVSEKEFLLTPELMQILMYKEPSVG